MLGSWAACINYMTPLGLHHLMQEGHHYGPDPGFNAAPRADWNNVYYHRADAAGLGFDRSSTGSNAVSQYHSPCASSSTTWTPAPKSSCCGFITSPGNIACTPAERSGRNCSSAINEGVDFVEKMIDIWQRLQPEIDPQRHEHVSRAADQQLDNARLWREVCLNYFGQFIHGENT